MDYDMKGREYCLQKFKENNVLFVREDKEKGLLYGAHKIIGRVIYSYDWPKFIELEDRAGFLNNNIAFNGQIMQWRNDKQQRIIPCVEPEYFISIDYDGNVTPCCHIRADNPNHKDYVMGNIKNQSLLNIISSDKWMEFKELVGSEDYSKYPTPCQNCHKYRDIKGTFENNIYT